MGFAKDGKKVTLTALSYERLPEIPLAVQATAAALKKVGSCEDSDR